ncbi:MAG: Gfo/Idh/MocA family oxidoreductase [Desulfobacterales bacterium]|nr:Gfo/Idh/MocA family oxidoreductase [Desulfobacterales bacterium]
MSSMHLVPFAKYGQVRVGLVGVGWRGLTLLHELCACEGAVITAVADELAERLDPVRAWLAKTGRPQPLYFSGSGNWQRLLEIDLDLVIIATSWQTHASLAIAAMEAGKHTALEVPAAMTIEECWQLVETCERTRRHCIILENCCYGYWEMLVKRMVMAGKLGTLTHAECAYIHNLRHQLFFMDDRQGWRRQAHIHLNGNHYPTHGLGPVAKCLQIGAGDAFDYLVSMSSREAGLSEYRDQNLATQDPRRKEVYSNGDVNVSLLRTKLGRTIVLQHDVVTPRPYDRIFLIGGTKGTFRDYPPRLYLDEITQSEEEWLDPAPYRADWEDPLWKEHGAQALAAGGHGGMDYLMILRLIEAMRQGQPPDIDVYEAAEWSAPGPLSIESGARRSAPLDFPDFRRP